MISDFEGEMRVQTTVFKTLYYTTRYGGDCRLQEVKRCVALRYVTFLFIGNNADQSSSCGRSPCWRYSEQNSASLSSEPSSRRSLSDVLPRRRICSDKSSAS